MSLNGSDFRFLDIHVAQTAGVQKPFKVLLPRFDRVIEIGTYNGGFTLFLHKNIKEGCELISYDIDAELNKVPSEYNIDFRIGDCFSEEVVDEIKNLIIEVSKRVLLLCDGGNKNEEFNLFSQFLKINDVIMLHDYGESLVDYRKVQKAINWCPMFESSLDKINDSINRYNLSKYYYEELKYVLWGSFVKIGVMYD